VPASDVGAPSTRGREERVDQLGLPETGRLATCLLSPDATARATCELAGCRRAASHDRRDLLERHAEHVVQHERDALCWRERGEHDQQRESDRVGEQRLVLGSDPAASLAAGSGTSGPSGTSGRERRACNMFRHTRERTVVSQLPRFSIEFMSERPSLTLSQASWTASSASLAEPSMR
jgi:hypothetical protein